MIRNRPIALPAGFFMALIASQALALPFPGGLQLPSSSIEGRVIDARTGAPLRDVIVQLQGTVHMSVTGADGGFVMLGVEPGGYILYVSVIGYGLVRRPIELAAGGRIQLEVPLSEGTGTYIEQVTVEAEAVDPEEPGVPGQITLGTGEMQNLRGVLTDDPMRAVQVAPGVATGDDFRSEFSIRGSDPRNIGLSLDGVPNVLFIHKARGIEDTGSVALINGDVVESVSILSGGYPQRFGNRIGAQVDFTTRTGTRARTQVRGSVSGSSASVVAEGPLSGRNGSWLATFRQSYLGWLIKRIDPEADGTANFTNGQASVVYDLGADHQLRFNFVVGRLVLDESDESPSLNRVVEGTNEIGIGNLSWWWAPTERAFLVQRLWLAADDFRNINRVGNETGSGSTRNFGYRADFSSELAGRSGFEAGVDLRRETAEARVRRYNSQTGALVRSRAEEGSATSAGGYAQIRWAPASTITLNAGSRIDHWSLIEVTELSPWVQVEWVLASRTRLRAATGLFRQSPELDRLLGPRGNPELRPERAWHVDVGVETEVSDLGKWQVNLYNREERDVLRLPGSETRVLDGELVRDSNDTIWQNDLGGHSRGIELGFRRDRPNGFSGWFAYALSYTRFEDQTTGEMFWGDFDQRHTLNLWGKYRFTSRFELSSKLRVGSNFPISGYYREEEGRYFAADTKNTTRLPTYVRWDVRGNYTFNFRRSRMTLFVEVINVLNRNNIGPGEEGFVSPFTFEVRRGLVEELFPILPSAGILWEF